jgi:hypothetical protein
LPAELNPAPLRLVPSSECLVRPVKGLATAIESLQP